MNAPCVIIGSSHAAAQLSISIRQQGWEDDIIVIGKETHLPYQKPPLSKAFLSENKSLEHFLLKPRNAYEKAQVTLKLGSGVTEINRQDKSVTLENGEVILYSKLALCTGAESIELSLAQQHLEGIHYLRSADDALRLKNEITPQKNAVIIGGGFIGLEVAAVLNEKGMNVTILEAQDNILQRAVSPEVSQFIAQLHQSVGVTIKTNTMAEAIEGTDHVTAITCQTGESIPADLVVIGVGVLPNTALAEQCGLAIDNGVCINEYAQTSDVDIVAAGDCTHYFHALYQKGVRLESIQNALDQAKSAAASINGKQLSFTSNVPRFWSDQYDVKLQICGLIDGYDNIKIEQNIQQKKFNALYLKNNKIVAAVAINNPKLLAKAQVLIKSAQLITPQQLDAFFDH